MYTYVILAMYLHIYICIYIFSEVASNPAPLKETVTTQEGSYIATYS